jgi:hypothetical protein
MKSWVSIFFTVLTAGCTAVQKHGAFSVSSPQTASIVIDFQTGFTGNWVQVRLGGERIFSGAVTTDNRIGLAGTLRYPASGDSALDVIVSIDHSRTYTFRVDLKRGRYLGLEQDLDDKSIRLIQNHEPFMYD